MVLPLRFSVGFSLNVSDFEVFIDLGPVFLMILIYFDYNQEHLT